ncbi:Diaminopimelate decarboxylase [subsurface metagenome]
MEEIARTVGTPFYLYSQRTLLRHYNVFEEAFREIEHLVCFSMKVNSNLTLCKILSREGCGADIVSRGELFKALKAGIPPEKIVFAGVGKTSPEIEYALKNDILMFNVESIAELESINKLAGNLEKKARIALRINPDIDPQTHPHISTGLRESKFGIEFSKSRQVYRLARKLDNIDVAGVHFHIGSQITQVSPFVEALEKIVSLVKDLEKEGIKLEYIDVGGGLGIRYCDEEPPSPGDYARAIIPLVKKTGCKLILEPGRAIMGNAGILVTKVLYLKESGQKKFIIVDAGMNDIIRPSLYGAYHTIVPLKKISTSKTTPSSTVDIVGPICESTDFFAKDREFPPVQPEDLLAILTAGAYGFTLSSNYNARLRVPEVLVKDDKHHIIRKRETYQDLIAPEEVSDV